MMVRRNATVDLGDQDSNGNGYMQFYETLIGSAALIKETNGVSRSDRPDRFRTAPTKTSIQRRQTSDAAWKRLKWPRSKNTLIWLKLDRLGSHKYVRRLWGFIPPLCNKKKSEQKVCNMAVPYC